MSAHNKEEQDEPFRPEPIPVKDLPYFDTLREVMQPYLPAGDLATATEFFTSGEIIAAIETHHGVPQGPVGKNIYRWVMPSDFVRAMQHLGFREANTGGLQLQWMCKLK